MKTKLKPCPACGREIAKSATTCVHCGKNMTSAGRLGLIVLSVLLLAVIFGWGYFRMIAKGNEDLERIESDLRSQQPHMIPPPAAEDERRTAEARDKYLEEMGE